MLLQPGSDRPHHLERLVHRHQLAPLGPQHLVKLLQPLLIGVFGTKPRHEVLAPRRVPASDTQLLCPRHPPLAAATERRIVGAHQGDQTKQPVDRLLPFPDKAVANVAAGCPRTDIPITELLTPALHRGAPQVDQRLQQTQLGRQQVSCPAVLAQLDSVRGLAKTEQLRYQGLTHFSPLPETGRCLPHHRISGRGLYFRYHRCRRCHRERMHPATLS